MMDPPWKYGSKSSGVTQAKKNSSAIIPDHHYPTLQHEEMCELIVPKIHELADPLGCLAFVWITNKHFPQAIDLMRLAGFEWVNIAFVWDKGATNLGFYSNPSCEFVGLFKRGKPQLSLGKPQDTKVQQLFTAKKSTHSRKPKEVHRRIERLFPKASKIELFARNHTEGWDCWGNETDKFEIDNNK